MKRILVALDDSENAKRALGLAMQFAQKFEASLVLAYAVAPIPIMGDAPSVDLLSLQKEQEAWGQGMLEAHAAVVRDAGISVTVEVAQGAAAEALTELAARLQCDLLVVGSRGRNAVARVLLGSVSTRLIHVAKCPVMVVP